MVIIPYLPILSLPLIILGVFEYIRIKGLVQKGQKTQGKVVEIDEDREGNIPIIAFQDWQGNERRFRVQTILAHEQWVVHSVWPVIYDPLNSTFARVERPAQLWGRVIFYGTAWCVSGVVLTCLSLIF